MLSPSCLGRNSKINSEAGMLHSENKLRSVSILEVVLFDAHTYMFVASSWLYGPGTVSNPYFLLAHSHSIIARFSYANKEDT